VTPGGKALFPMFGLARGLKAQPRIEKSLKWDIKDIIFKTIILIFMIFSKLKH
jgi:hypothetical protein